MRSEFRAVIMSPHFYTLDEELDTAMAAVDEILRALTVHSEATEVRD